MESKVPTLPSGLRRVSGLQGALVMVLALGVGCKSDGGDLEDAGAKSDGGANQDAQVPSPDGGMDADGGTPDGGSQHDGGPQPDGGGGEGGGGFSASTSSLDFGLAPCGGDAPASQTITFTNTSSASIAYTATLSSTSAFAIVGAENGSKSGTIAVGQTGSLTIDASAVGTGATAGQPITAMLTVTSASLPAPTHAISVPVSVTPEGARLSLDPAGAPNWTLVQRGQAGAPFTVRLLNAGNRPATVQLTQPTKSEFKLYDGSALATTVTVPAASGGTAGSYALRATFAPQIVGPYTSSAGLSVSGPVCQGGGASISSISFSGAATGTGFTAEATTPLAGRVSCGATGAELPSATITVGNYSEQTLEIDLSMFNEGNSPFDLSEHLLTVLSGGTATVQATVKPARVTSAATPGTELTDMMLLTPPASSGLSPIPVFLSTTVQGATLSFGSVNAYTSATPRDAQTQAIVVTNSGNYPVSPTLTLAGANPERFAITEALSPATIPETGPGQSTVVVSFTPRVGDASEQTAELVLTPGPTDVICGGVPEPLALSGTANTPGFVLQDPASGTIRFGNNGFVSCPPGDDPAPSITAAPRMVTVRNSGSTLLTWHARIDSSAFTVLPNTGTVAAGQTGTFLVTPGSITLPAHTEPNYYGGQLTITTDIVGDSDHIVPIEQTAQGAILAITDVTTSLGQVNVIGQSPITPFFTLSNVGNDVADVSLDAAVSALGSAQYQIFGMTASRSTHATQSRMIAPNTSVNYTVSFDPADELIYDPAVDLATSRLTSSMITSSPLCAELPVDVFVEAEGTSEEVTFSVGSSLELATQTCNVQTNAPTTVVVSNFRTTPVNITDVALLDGTWFRAYIGAPSIVSVTVPPISQGTPGTAAITIAPKFISTSAGQPVHGTSVTDTLTISTSVSGVPQPDKTVDISQPVYCP